MGKCVCVCMFGVCVRACVRAYVCVCVRVYILVHYWLAGWLVAKEATLQRHCPQ